MRTLVIRLVLAGLTIFAFTHAAAADYVSNWP